VKYSILIIVVLLTIFTACNVQKSIQKSEIQSSADSLSYCIGISVASNLKEQGIPQLNEVILAKAIQDVYTTDQQLLIDATASQDFIMAYFTKEEAKKYEEIKTSGENFLKENAVKEGVITLESGVQYKILEAGSGKIPIAEDMVTTHYHGMLVDGTVFDSSIERGEPVSFPVDGVIEGWQEVLKLMPTGSTWEVYIPYDKAYGANGVGEVIPPFSALIFKVQLLSIDK
jgi:FKBP-type peptidyl-prolyl cis-trans isomerase FklB